MMAVVVVMVMVAVASIHCCPSDSLTLGAFTNAVVAQLEGGKERRSRVSK